MKKSILVFMIFSVCSGFYVLYSSSTDANGSQQSQPDVQQSRWQRVKAYVSTKSQPIQQRFWKMIKSLQSASKSGYDYVRGSRVGESVRRLFTAMLDKSRFLWSEAKLDQCTATPNVVDWHDYDPMIANIPNGVFTHADIATQEGASCGVVAVARALQKIEGTPEDQTRSFFLQKCKDWDRFIRERNARPENRGVNSSKIDWLSNDDIRVLIINENKKLKAKNGSEIVFVDYATIYFGGDNRKGFTQLLDTYKAKLRGNEIDVIHVVMGPIQRIEGFDNLAHFMYYAITRSEPGLPAWFHIHCDDSLQLYERRQWGAEFLYKFFVADSFEEWIKNGVFLNEIFERVTGMPEAAGMALPFVRNETDELTYIHNPLTNQGFCCGKITHSTLAQLRAQELEAPVSLGAPSFTVICYIGTKPARYAEADICALQAHPDNNGAVFQLASRFHALEGGTAHGGLNKATTQKPNCGFFSGMSKPVQGEYASFSAAPGTIFKMYGPESINLLAGTPFGHLINPEQSDGGMPTVAEIIKIAQTIPENWTDNLQIYFHEEIDVVVGQQTKPPKSWQARAETEKRQFILRQPLNRIHQIPVASFDWANLNKADVPRLSQITQQMLCGFYEGTLLSAALHGKRKIFLTAVGGGSFHNNLDVILAAIANDRNLGIIQKYGLEVTLVIHEINAQERVGCWVHVIDGVYKTPDFEYHGADLSTPYIVRGKFNII